MASSTADKSVRRPVSPAAARRLPIGAEVVDRDHVHFRVWAPAARDVQVVIQDSGLRVALNPEPQGYFSGDAAIPVGSRYMFCLDGSERLYPDPASRYQPEGPHGPSEVIDPSRFHWTDEAWPGITLANQIIYELHTGTFTPEGTWRAAAEQLPELARLGITLIELMPIADFDGRFGWGYDGVDLYAPSHLYGAADDLRYFIDRAHASGIGVVLDVVYNHLGPSGNYLRNFSPAYFTDRYENEWGDAINFDGPDSMPVREFVIENAGFWIDEFHFDGLRLDATQQIFDASDENVMTAIAKKTREKAGVRSVVTIAENEPQDSALVRPTEQGGIGLDALWNDDFHHSAMVAATGHNEAYYRDTRGVAQELISAAKYGYLFQGQFYEWQRKRRGTASLDISPAQFVAYLQNHDQVANSAMGRRLHQLTSPGRWRALTALLLLMPETPMLFQGQEFAASSPFLYFADFEPSLAEAVRKGRGDFLAQFPSIKSFERSASLDDPSSAATFERSKLDFAERTTHAWAYQLHEDLIRLRALTPAFRAQRRGGVDGAVLASYAFILRFFAERGDDERVLIVNLGRDLHRRSFAEPLLAPPAGCDWIVEWSTEDARYGGGGMPDFDTHGRWAIPGESAIVLAPERQRSPNMKSVRRRTA